MDSQPSTSSSKNLNVGRDVNIRDGDLVMGAKTENKFEGGIHFHLGVTTEGVTKQKPSLEFPPLLPYLVNRKIQEECLSELLSRRDTLKPLPVVIVVHGNDKQAHDMFFERLKEEFLPRKLNINNSDVSIRRFGLPWPEHIRGLGDLKDLFTRDLAEKVLGDSNAPLEQIQATLAGYNCPTIFDTYLLTHDWMKFKKGILEAILGFWNDWKMLKPNQALFAFVFITHKTHGKGPWKEMWFNLQKKQVIKQLDECKFDGFMRIMGTVLPELGNISLTETENWARSEKTAMYYGKFVQPLIEKIRDIHDKQEEMPMEILADHLRQFLVSA